MNENETPTAIQSAAERVLGEVVTNEGVGFDLASLIAMIVGLAQSVSAMHPELAEPLYDVFPEVSGGVDVPTIEAIRREVLS